MKRLILALLCTVAATAACDRFSALTGTRSRGARMTIVTDRPAFDDLAKLPPDQARRIRPAIFRLRPDRRALIALGELERLVRGESTPRLQLVWTGDSWRIESRDGLVATATEVSSYVDLRRLLTARARTLLATAKPSKPDASGRIDRSGLSKACDAFEADGVIAALRKLGSVPRGSLPDGDAAALEAHAFVLLSVQSLDTLEMADLLRARALALLALAEARGHRPDAADEALLAFSLDYAADAARTASGLPEDDPVRLYVAGKTPELVRVAELPGASPIVRFMALMSLGSAGDPAAWAAFEQKQFASSGFSLPVLRAAARLRSFEMNSALGNATLYATLLALPGFRPSAEAAGRSTTPEWSEKFVRQFVAAVSSQLHLERAALLRNFESALAHECHAPRGELWDSETCEAWYRGFFYSGLYTLGRRYLDELADVEGTRELAAYLEGSPPGPAAQFARWYGDMSATLSGQRAGENQLKDLSELTWLGRPVLERTATVLIEQYRLRRDISPEVVATLAQRFDGRPAHVDAMTQFAGNPLLDSPMVERLCRAWIDLGLKSEENRAIRCTGYLAGMKELEALFARRDVEVATRADALMLYCYLPYASDPFCRTQFRALAEESGYERAVTRAWLDYTDKHKEWADAEKAAEGWLAHHDESAGLVWYIYRGRLANSLSLQGRHSEAWAVIEPVLRSGQGAVMGWATEILERLGRTEEAIALGRRAIERYPDGGGQRAVLAEVLWRANRDDDAALVLNPPEQGYKVDEATWRDDVAGRFAGVFAKQADARVEAALKSLEGRKLWERNLSYLIPPLAASGRNALAFQLQSALEGKGLHAWVKADLDLQAFGYLEKARGRAEAIAWLQKSIPPSQRDGELEGFFDQKAFPLLWDAVAPEEESKLSGWIWLLRAGATIADPAVGAAHGEDVLAHFHDPMPREPSRILARYLLRLEDRNAALAAATGPADRCNAAYFFGLDQIASGRYADASDWFQIPFDGCMKAGMWKPGSFARTILGRWLTFGQSLNEAELRGIW